MPEEQWRRNLYIVAFAEFIVLVGFSLFVPFMPLYVQQVGGFGAEESAFWAGIATGCAGLAMFLSSPVWGIIADRWGRKPMLLRAQFGGVAVAILFIFTPNIYFLVFFRMLQGLFTGTVSAAAALVSSMTPKKKLPFSMGVLMAAVLGGQTLGPLLGGFLEDNYGFTTTFIITACLLGAGGLIILLLVKENFQRPAVEQRNSMRSMVRLAFSREIFPLLMVLSALSVGPQIASPVLPLIIGSMSHSGGAASASGVAYALMGIVAAISSLVFGRIHGRFPIRNILVFSCIGTGLLFLPPIWANSTLQLIILMGLSGLLNGGIITSSNSLVSLSVPVTQQGIAYGLSQSASSLGGGIGPFIGGGLAPVIGLRYVFAVTAGIFILVGLVASKVIPASLSGTRENTSKEGVSPSNT
jgi:MFS transporter, DHA1 family, multidrug resistance protein